MSFPLLFKQYNGNATKFLTKLFNESLLNGIVPHYFKKSIVIPVFEKGSKSDPMNYRPISLLSNLNKILEKLVKTRLQRFINKHSIMYNLQFGFRQNHATTDAITYIYNDLIDKIDDRLVVLYFLFFRKPLTPYHMNYYYVN